MIFRVYGFAEIKKKETNDKNESKQTVKKLGISSNTSGTFDQSTIDTSK